MGAVTEGGHLMLDEEQSSRTKSLELAYKKCLHDVRIICEEEKARQLRLRVLLLEDENDDLHEQLAQEDDRIDVLENDVEEAQQRISVLDADLHGANSELRMKNREVEALKAELDSLQDVSMGSTKLLTEKLSLTRELSQLKPELEHLRAQAASNQTLLSEKLSLQRQLSTLQVELETEKRASTRALARGGKDEERESQLERDLETSRKELAKEKREKERMEKEAKKAMADWEAKKAILESKLEAFRTKLRSTKDLLKESQAELQQVRAAVTSTREDNTGKNPRKRTTSQADIYGTVGTPGADASHSRPVQRVAPGEKSTFSITPFLNRTASIAPESPPRDSDEDQAESAAQQSQVEAPASAQGPSAEPESAAAVVGAKMAIGKAAAARTGVLTTSKPSKANGKARANPKRVALPPLEKVMEEDENTQPAESVEHAVKPKQIKRIGNKPLTIFSTDEDPEPKLKKRKLLGGGPGKTLFDEEDEGAPKPSVRGIFAKGKKLSALGGTGSSKGVFGAAPKVSGFGEFSPLKKDRKAMAA